MTASTDKIIWFKKAKCAGTSFESVLQKHGAIYYVHPKTTRADLEAADNRVICIREGLFPYGKTRMRYGCGDYRMEGSNLVFRLRNRLGRPFLPKAFMYHKFPEFMADHFKFAIVRNPYDKFISSWKYLKTTRDLDIESVLENLPGRERFHDWVHITQLQADTVTGPDGDIALDKVIYMERDFDSDISELLERLELAAEAMPQQNRSTRKGHLDYLTPPVAESIHRIYERDFLCFGYSADPRNLSPV